MHETLFGIFMAIATIFTHMMKSVGRDLLGAAGRIEAGTGGSNTIHSKTRKLLAAQCCYETAAAAATDTHSSMSLNTT